MYYAGLRPAEAAGLRLKDCHLPRAGWGRLIDRRVPAPGQQAVRPTAGRRHENAGSSIAARKTSVPCPSRQNWSGSSGITSPSSGPARTAGSSEASGRRVASTAYTKVWQEARTSAFTPAQVASPLARRPYDLRHAAVSLWLNAGVPAPEVAERAGHGVDVLLRVYAKCIDGQQEIANRRIHEALAA